MSEEQYEQPQEQPAPEPVPDEDRVRYEDNPANFPQDTDFVPAETSSEEVPLESQRKDETTVLATDVPEYPAEP